MTQTVLLQATVMQQTRTCTLPTRQTRVARHVLAPPRAGMSLSIRSEGEERLWRARTSTSRSLSNMYVSPPFEMVSHRGRGTGARSVAACLARLAAQRQGMSFAFYLS